MARIFEKYVAPDSQPIKIEHTKHIPEPREKTINPSADASKTLRFNHNAIRMADMIDQSPREEAETGEDEDSDPDAALMMPMYWLMKGLRGMMQIAGSK